MIYFQTGIINSEGSLWRSQRRFLLKQKLGMRNATHWGPSLVAKNNAAQIEATIKGEVLGVLNLIAEEKVADGAAFSLQPLLDCAISNVICSMVMSKRFSHGDPRFHRFMELFGEGFRLFLDTGYLHFIPQLKHFSSKKTAFCVRSKSSLQ